MDRVVKFAVGTLLVSAVSAQECGEKGATGCCALGGFTDYQRPCDSQCKTWRPQVNLPGRSDEVAFPDFPVPQNDTWCYWSQTYPGPGNKNIEKWGFCNECAVTAVPSDAPSALPSVSPTSSPTAWASETIAYADGGGTEG